MFSTKVAKRYAQGLLDFTKETQQTDLLFDEMKTVVQVLKDSAELNRFLNTPFIDYKKKTIVATEIFKSLSPVTQNLIKLVIKQGRESQLRNIAQAFIDKVEAEKGIQKVTLTLASPISEATIKTIIDQSNMVKQNPDVQTIINPEILGGYILRVGDQQIDASVKTKLMRVRKQFQNN